MATINRSWFGYGLMMLLVSGCYHPTHVSAPDRALEIYTHKQAAISSPTPEEGESRSFNLEKAVSISQARDAQVASARAAVRAAEAEVDAATQLENPVLRMRQIEVDEMLRGESEFGMELRASPPRPGELEARKDRSQARVHRLQARVDETRWAMEAEIRNLFVSAQYLKMEEEVLGEVVSARAALLEGYRIRSEEGLATALDVAEADVEWRSAAQEAALIRGSRMEAEQKLRVRMGIPPGTPIELQGEPVDPGRLVPLPARDEMMRTSLSRRSELAEAASRIDAAEADIYLEKAQAYPWFSFVEVGYRFGVEEIDPRDWTFRFALTLPIFSWNLGGIRAANATKDWMESRFEAEVERVSREVEDRYAAVQTAADAVVAAHGDSSDAVHSAYQKTLDAMNEGGVDALRVAQAKVRLAQLRRQQIRSLHGYAQALQALFVATRGAADTAD